MLDKNKKYSKDAFLSTFTHSPSSKNRIMKGAIIAMKHFFILGVLLIITKEHLVYSQLPNLQPTIADTNSSSLQPDTNKTANSIKVNTNEINNSDDGGLDAPVTYHSDEHQLVDLKNQKTYLIGNAWFKYQDIELKADTIIIFMDKNEVLAKYSLDSNGNKVGKPEFSQGKEKLTSDIIRYNFETKRAYVKNGVTAQQEMAVLTDVAKYHDNGDIHAKNAKFSTCTHPEPHFYFQAGKAVIKPDDVAVTGPVNLWIADIPTPLALPFGFFPNQSSRSSGLIIPEYGQSATRGLFLRNGGYYFLVNDRFDTRFIGDIYSRGNWALENYSRYKTRYKYNGNFRLRYFIDKLGDEVTNTNTKSREFLINWTHNQDPKAQPNSTFTANVNIRSRNQTQADLAATDREFLSNTFASSINYRKKFEGTPFSFTASATHSQNSQTGIVQIALPNTNFSVSRIYPFKKLVKKGKVKKGWLEKTGISDIGVTYSNDFRNQINVADTLITLSNFDWLNKNSSFGMNHRINASTGLKFFNKIISVNPNFSFVDRWYLKTISKRYDNLNQEAITDTVSGFERSYDYRIGASMTTNLYGFYGFKGKKQTALRHVLTPSLSFNYTPGFDSQIFGYFGTNGTLTNYSPFDGGIFGKAPSNASGNIGINLRNTLEMKRKSEKDTVTGFKKIKLIEQLNLSTSHNIFADSLKWAQVNVNFRTKLFNNIIFNSTSRIDPYFYTDSGVKLNVSRLKQEGKIGRLTNSNLSVSFSLNNQMKAGNNNRSNSIRPVGLPGQQQDEGYLEDYLNENVPWNLFVTYSVNLNRQYINFRDTSIITQTIATNGDIRFTKNWRMSFSLNYDIQNKNIPYSSFRFHRELHCWEMSFDWIPFGTRKSWNFKVNIKSGTLKELQWEKRKLRYDNEFN